MKKILRVMAVSAAILLIAGVLFVVNAFVGNPISKMIVSHQAQKYIEATYPNTDYYIDSVNYSFKISGYHAHIKSPSSKDTYFSVSYGMLGEVGYDNFDAYVARGFNTWDRINSDYRLAVDKVIETLPYETHIAYGEVQTREKNNGFGLDMEALELDKDYDIAEMGSQYGKITLYVYVDEVTTEKATEVLREVKAQFDRAKQPFYAIDVVLRLPKNEDKKDWQDDERIRIEDILYTDIDDDLLAKVEENITQTKEKYEALDKQKQMEIKEAERLNE